LISEKEIKALRTRCSFSGCGGSLLTGKNAYKGKPCPDPTKYSDIFGLLELYAQKSFALTAKRGIIY